MIYPATVQATKMRPKFFENQLCPGTCLVTYLSNLEVVVLQMVNDVTNFYRKQNFGSLYSRFSLDFPLNSTE